MVGAQFTAGLSGQPNIPPHLLAALVPLLVLLAVLDIYCLVDLARAKSVRHAPKLAWAIAILAPERSLRRAAVPVRGPGPWPRAGRAGTGRADCALARPANSASPGDSRPAARRSA